MKHRRFCRYLFTCFLALLIATTLPASTARVGHEGTLSGDEGTQATPRSGNEIETTTGDAAAPTTAGSQDSAEVSGELKEKSDEGRTNESVRSTSVKKTLSEKLREKLMARGERMRLGGKNDASTENAQAGESSEESSDDVASKVESNDEITNDQVHESNADSHTSEDHGKVENDDLSPPEEEVRDEIDHESTQSTQEDSVDESKDSSHSDVGEVQDNGVEDDTSAVISAPASVIDHDAVDVDANVDEVVSSLDEVRLEETVEKKGEEVEEVTSSEKISTDSDPTISDDAKVAEEEVSKIDASEAKASVLSMVQSLVSGAMGSSNSEAESENKEEGANVVGGEDKTEVTTNEAASTEKVSTIDVRKTITATDVPPPAEQMEEDVVEAVVDAAGTVAHVEILHEHARMHASRHDELQHALRVIQSSVQDVPAAALGVRDELSSKFALLLQAVESVNKTMIERELPDVANIVTKESVMSALVPSTEDHANVLQAVERGASDGAIAYVREAMRSMLSAADTSVDDQGDAVGAKEKISVIAATIIASARESASESVTEMMQKYDLKWDEVQRAAAETVKTSVDKALGNAVDVIVEETLGSMQASPIFDKEALLAEIRTILVNRTEDRIRSLFDKDWFSELNQVTKSHAKQAFQDTIRSTTESSVRTILNDNLGSIEWGDIEDVLALHLMETSTEQVRKILGIDAENRNVDVGNMRDVHLFIFCYIFLAVVVGTTLFLGNVFSNWVALLALLAASAAHATLDPAESAELFIENARYVGNLCVIAAEHPLYVSATMCVLLCLRILYGLRCVRSFVRWITDRCCCCCCSGGRANDNVDTTQKNNKAFGDHIVESLRRQIDEAVRRIQQTNAKALRTHPESSSSSAAAARNDALLGRIGHLEKKIETLASVIEKVNRGSRISSSTSVLNTPARSRDAQHAKSKTSSASIDRKSPPMTVDAAKTLQSKRSLRSVVKSKLNREKAGNGSGVKADGSSNQKWFNVDNFTPLGKSSPATRPIAAASPLSKTDGSKKRASSVLKPSTSISHASATKTLAEMGPPPRSWKVEETIWSTPKKEKKEDGPASSTLPKTQQQRATGGSDAPATVAASDANKSTEPWKELKDEATGKTYFWNQRTGKTQWNEPDVYTDIHGKRTVCKTKRS